MIAKSREINFYLSCLRLGKGLLRNAPKFYYKMRQLFLLLNAAKKVAKRGSFFITKCVNVITKRDQYYKMYQFYTESSITNVSYYNLLS